MTIAVKKVDVLGIKVWYGEAFTMSKYLAQQVHRYSPNTVVIAGGYHASLYEEDVLRYGNFDLAVAGSGEGPLVKILELVNDFDKFSKQDFLNNLSEKMADNPIPGLIYRKGPEIVKTVQGRDNGIGSTVPVYPEKTGKIKVHILLESLGCPWNDCNFCVHNKFSKGYRQREVKEIIQEMKEMIKQGIALFRFAGSDTPPSFGMKIAGAIIENKLEIEYTMGCRAVKNCRDDSIYRNTVDAFYLMIKSGLRGIFMGGETGNDLINHEIMNKGIKAEDIRFTIKALREAEKKAKTRCTVSLAMIYPTPTFAGIDISEIEKDNLRLIEEVVPDALMVSPPGPFKNTRWYCEAEKFGFVLKDNYIQRMMEYEYVLYKPLNLWPELPFTLRGMGFVEMLAITQAFKDKVEKNLGIPTDLSDEHFLMIRSSGEFSDKRIRSFKRKSQLSIISSNYAYLNRIGRKMSRYSRNLANKNNLKLK